MEKKLAIELKTCGACSVCILRMLNIRDSDKLRNADTELNKILGKKPSEDDLPKIKKPNPCCLCLGLLQLDEISSLQTNILKILKPYDDDELSFSLFLPVSVILRNFSIFLHLSSKFESYGNTHTFDDQMGLSWENNVVPLKEAWKIMVAPDLASSLGKKLNSGVESLFQINIHFDYRDDEVETKCMLEMHPDIFSGRELQQRKYKSAIVTRKSVESALEQTSLEQFKRFSPVPPEVPNSFMKCSQIVCTHDSIYIAGRYTKFSRSLSQTPWMIQGERRMESSVEEIISNPVSEKIPNDGIKFMSSGREDVDVRTLGYGRPFVLDIANPRKVKLANEELRELQHVINKSSSEVQVRDLQVVSKNELAFIKLGEVAKTKTYEAFCITKNSSNQSKEYWIEKLNGLDTNQQFVIQQRTPIRVLHRRPLAIRPRTVFWMKTDFYKLDTTYIFFKLRLKVEAGTYIKELIHGDFGRTSPNISALLDCETDILALDVQEVALDWPPKIDHENGCSEESDNK